MSRSLGLAALLALAVSAPVAAADPVTYRCDDGSAVTATFLQTEPPAAIVTDAGRLYALPLRISASGARYATADEDAAVSFWTKGDEAFFEVAGRASRTCRSSAE